MEIVSFVSGISMPTDSPLPYPSPQRVGQIRSNSLRMLKDIWTLPASELGPDSDVFAKAENNWWKSRAFSFPEDPELNQKYIDANRIAWWVLWRAYDFSAESMAKRIRDDRIWGHNGPWHSAVVYVDKVDFSPIHEPLIDRFGNFRNKSQPDAIDHFLGQSEIFQLYFNGAVLCSERKKKHLSVRDKSHIFKYIYSQDSVNLNKGSVERSWFFGATMNVSQSLSFKSCFLEQGISISTTANGKVGFKASTLAGVRAGGDVSLKQMSVDASEEWPNDIAVRGELEIPYATQSPIKLAHSTPFVTLYVCHESKRITLTGECEYLTVHQLGKGASFRIKDFKVKTLAFKDVQSSEIFLDHAIVLNSMTIDGGYPADFHIRNSTFGDGAKGWLELEPADGSNPIETITIQNSKMSGFIKFEGIHAEYVQFRGTHFSRTVSFKGATVSKSLDISSDTSPCRFDGRIDVGCRMQDDDALRSLGAVSLASATVAGIVNFNNRIMDERADFDGTQFDEVPTFFGTQMSQDTSFRDAALTWKSNPVVKTGVIQSFCANFVNHFSESALKRNFIRTARRTLSRGYWGDNGNMALFMVSSITVLSKPASIYS